MFRSTCFVLDSKTQIVVVGRRSIRKYAWKSADTAMIVRNSRNQCQWTTTTKRPEKVSVSGSTTAFLVERTIRFTAFFLALDQWKSENPDQLYSFRPSWSDLCDWKIWSGVQFCEINCKSKISNRNLIFPFHLQFPLGVQENKQRLF